MKRKTEFRICEDCGESKRTTVELFEEPVYYCEECQKKTARVAYKKSSPVVGFIIAAIIAIVAFMLGKYLF